jgi:ubiquinone/menaquinone biosynthesis C-methylase UbiE
VPDVYATITEADPAVVEGLAAVLELRAADERQRDMREEYFAEIPFPHGAHVLEVGCGTGAVTRALAGWPGVAEAVGVDPSQLFVARARELAQGIPNLTFVEGDGRALPFEDASLDVVVFHTSLCHVPEPERALEEAVRVVRPKGSLVVFDGDYATTTVALGEADPLQACAEAFMGFAVHDRWLVRRLPTLARAAGVAEVRLRSHAYLESPEAGYMLAVVERGADVLVATGRLGAEAGEALKREARRRSDEGVWFGFIAYASLIGSKP